MDCLKNENNYSFKNYNCSILLHHVHFFYLDRIAPEHHQ